MCTRWIRLCLAGSMLLATVVPGAAAQSSNLTVTGYTGLAVPIGQFAEYATVGASAGLQLEYPVREPLAVVLQAGLDNPQSDAPGIPDFQLWRYQAGLEADLWGNPADSWRLRGQLGAGATTFRTGGFYPNLGAARDRLDKTYFTGTGGLALVFGADSPLHGYLAARVHWMPVDEGDWTALRSAALGTPPDPVDHVLSVPITLGLRVRA